MGAVVMNHLIIVEVVDMASVHEASRTNKAFLFLFGNIVAMFGAIT